MADAFDQAQLLDLHRRLIAGDQLASEAFSRLFLDYLVQQTVPKFARKYEQIAEDGAVDSLLEFFTSPEKFQPGRNPSLEAYLLHAAARDVANLIEGERRRKARERWV